MAAAEPQHRNAAAPIISLAEHLRRGDFTAAELDAAIIVGELFHEPPRSPLVIPRKRVLDALRGPWVVRRPIKKGRFAGGPRFIQTEDLPALALMRCNFSHAATWPVFWAITWRKQTQNPTDPETGVEISIEALMAATGHARASVYRAIKELTDRKMVEVLSGGGRHRSSTYFVYDPERWLL